MSRKNNTAKRLLKVAAKSANLSKPHTTVYNKGRVNTEGFLCPVTSRGKVSKGTMHSAKGKQTRVMFSGL
jgi:hypothetical protein